MEAVNRDWCSVAHTSKPDDNSRRFRIDISYTLDLLALFDEVGLIDADHIDPK